MKEVFSHLPKALWFFALAGAILNFGTAALRLGNFFPTPRLIDFSAFYASSWALRLGKSPYALPTSFLDDLVARTGMPLTPPPIYNPPIWPILTYPFAFLSYTPAAFLWIATNLAMLVAVTFLLSDIARVQGWKGRSISFLLMLTFGPVFLDLSIGQNSTFLLLMATIAGWSLHRSARHAEPIAALAVALAVGAKLFPLFWSGAFFLLRRWRLFTLTVGTTAGLFALSFLLFPDESLDYATVQLPGRLSSSVESVGINDQTLIAWLMRVFRPQSFTVQGISAFEMAQTAWAPVITLSEQAVNLIGYVALLAITGWAAVVIWRHGQMVPEAALFLWVLVGLLAFPHMERYNHVLLLPAMAWLWPRSAQAASIVVLAYFLSGMARLTHFWATALPGALAGLFTGFGVIAALLLTVGMLVEMTRVSTNNADLENIPDARPLPL